MAELSTLARPYAKAAFDYAHEHDVLNDWEEFLLLSSYFIKDDTFKQLLRNPAISAEKKSTALIDLYDSQISESENPVLLKIFKQLTKPKSNNKVSKELRNFVNQLAEFDRLVLMPEIYTHYRQHKAKVLKQVDAYVTTAYPLTDVQKTLIETKLTASLNATVVVHETVDESLIAGVTIKVGDKVVDDTIRGKLKQLKTQLTV